MYNKEHNRFDWIWIRFVNFILHVSNEESTNTNPCKKNSFHNLFIVFLNLIQWSIQFEVVRLAKQKNSYVYMEVGYIPFSYQTNGKRVIVKRDGLHNLWKIYFGLFFFFNFGIYEHIFPTFYFHEVGWSNHCLYPSFPSSYNRKEIQQMRNYFFILYLKKLFWG